VIDRHYMSRPKLATLVAAAFLLAAADSPKDLITIKDARSTAAEWSQVNRLAALGRLSHVYVETMRDEARGQLATALASLTDPNGRAASELKALARLPADADAGLVDLHVRRLLAVEHDLENR
jgi:hypothetical protein